MYGTLFLLISNKSYLLPLIAAVAFRTQILRLWENVADLFFLAWMAVRNLIFLLAASFVTVVLTVGNWGGSVLNEYALEHIHPWVCFILIEFSLMLTFLMKFVHLEDNFSALFYSLESSSGEEKVSRGGIFFRKPRFAMLQ